MQNQLQEARERNQNEQARQQHARAQLLQHVDGQDLAPEQANDHDPAQYPALLRCTEVQKRTGLSRSSIYARLNAADPTAYDASFPVPLNVSAASAKGGVSNRWLASEVDAWIANLPRTRVVAANDDQININGSGVKK